MRYPCRLCGQEHTQTDETPANSTHGGETSAKSTHTQTRHQPTAHTQRRHQHTERERERERERCDARRREREGGGGRRAPKTERAHTRGQVQPYVQKGQHEHARSCCPETPSLSLSLSLPRPPPPEAQRIHPLPTEEGTILEMFQGFALRAKSQIWP